MFSVPLPSLPLLHNKACEIGNFETDAHIKMDTAIDDPEWKNTVDFGILWKYDEKACAHHNFVRDAPINFIFEIAIGVPERKILIDLTIIGPQKCVYWSEMARNAIESVFRSPKWPLVIFF